LCVRRAWHLLFNAIERKKNTTSTRKKGECSTVINVEITEYIPPAEMKHEIFHTTTVIYTTTTLLFTRDWNMDLKQRYYVEENKKMDEISFLPTHKNYEKEPMDFSYCVSWFLPEILYLS
jgi:hypothetical protein